jgi:hypothetical protein
LDKTLKTLHLRLDSTSKSLTKNAVAQLIIKVLFSSENALSIIEIESGLRNVLKTSIDENRILASLEKLLEEKDIKKEKGKFLLIRANRKELSKRYNESNDRLNRIVKKYFTPFNSEESDVIEWFSDSTIEFFKSYSTEWISDLCYKKSDKVKTKKEDIFKHIERRTNNNKQIEKDDYNTLVKKFIDCITNKKDVDLDAHLWEYGTSAFAANLLQSSIGADPISISAFRDSKCIFDTNVLMNIGLEASEYHYAFKKLDKIFTELNINPGYLHITEEEYINTIANINKEILKNVIKFPFSVIKETDDEFIQSAIKRGCHLPEDFQSFCEQISTPPKLIDENQEILIFNDDSDLDKEIITAQQDEKKKSNLNDIFKNATGRDKRERPLLHDIGLIAGVEFYRKKDKAFILSQEISINKYAHSKPPKENLPLAIKLETLINMLAIDNGGTDVNPNDFSNLFADMIRFNLQPQKDTFEIADLSRLLDTELQIEQLPPNEVINIANNLHQNISKGLSDDEVSLELNRQFQDVKLKFVDDYDIAQEKLIYEKREKENHKRKLTKTELALRNRIKKEEFENYDSEVRKNQLIWYLAIPFSTVILTLIGIYFYNNSQSQTNFQNFIFGIIANIAFWLITSFSLTKPKMKMLNESKKNEIEDKIDKRLLEETK